MKPSEEPPEASLTSREVTKTGLPAFVERVDRWLQKKVEESQEEVEAYAEQERQTFRVKRTKEQVKRLVQAGEDASNLWRANNGGGFPLS